MQRLIQAIFQEPHDLRALADEPLLIHQRTQPTQNRSLVLFVHGLGGSRYGRRATWGRFPQFVYEDFPQLDVGLYAYRTLFRRLWFWRSISLESEAQIFAGILRDASEYDTLILVGHSMGGLVCKAAIAYLIETDQRDALARIAGLILMATPQLGSLRVPGFSALLSQDAYALRPHGRFVTKINRIFTDHLSLDEHAPSTRSVFVPTWAVRGASDAWVDELTANIGLPSRQQRLIHGSHTEIVKPSSKDRDGYQYVKACLSRCLTITMQQRQPKSTAEPNPKQAPADPGRWTHYTQHAQVIQNFEQVDNLNQNPTHSSNSHERTSDVSIDKDGQQPTRRSIDTHILQTLLAYYRQYSGAPEINMNALQETTRVKKPELISCLYELRHKGWIEFELTEQADIGLVWLTPKGRRVAGSIEGQ